jgi:hypothetical protein
MATKPERPADKPTARQIRENADEATQRVLMPSPPKAKKPDRPKRKVGKLSSLQPAILLWKWKIAAANEGMSPNRFLTKVLKHALKDYDYPTMPQWLKDESDEGEKVSTAA